MAAGAQDSGGAIQGVQHHQQDNGRQIKLPPVAQQQFGSVAAQRAVQKCAQQDDGSRGHEQNGSGAASSHVHKRKSRHCRIGVHTIRHRARASPANRDMQGCHATGSTSSSSAQFIAAATMPADQPLSVAGGGSRDSNGAAQANVNASLAAWAADAEGLCREGAPKPQQFIGISKKLQLVPTLRDVAQQEVQAAVAALHKLLQLAQSTPSLLMAVFLGSVAAAVDKHPKLLAAVAASHALSGALHAAFNTAAASQETYADARHLSQMAVAQRRLSMFCLPYWQALEAQTGLSVNPQAVANAYHAYASLYARSPQSEQPGQLQTVPLMPVLCERLETEVCQHAATMQPQALSNCLWAAASLDRLADSHLCTALLQTTLKSAGRLQPQSVSNTMWAIATARVAIDSETQGTLLQAAQRTAPNMNGQSVSNVMWAAASLQMPLSSDVCSALLQAAQRTAAQMAPQSLSMILWAFATAGIVAPDSVQNALLQAVSCAAPRMSPQSVANILWAMATGDMVITDSVRQPLLAAVQRNAHLMTSHSLANTLWSLATLNIHVQQSLASALHAAAASKAAHMNQQEVANTLWALSFLQACQGTACPVALSAALFRQAAALQSGWEPAGLHQVRFSRTHMPVALPVERGTLPVERGTWDQSNVGACWPGDFQPCARTCRFS